MVTNVLDYLERASEAWADRCAYEGPEGEITFRELKRRADILGSVLARRAASRGAVAVYMTKGIAMAAAFFGAASSGRSYCPLDTAMPRERMLMILETLRPSAIITAKAHEGEVQGLGYQGPLLIYEDALWEGADPEALADIRRGLTDMDPLYILFTSGSTGVPKGVVLPHRAVIDYMEWITGRFGLCPGDVLGNQAELFFDLSVQDVYAPVVCGCRTVMLRRELFLSPEALMTCLEEKGVTVLVWAPSALCTVANLDGMGRVVPVGLRLVMFCGEVMPCRQLNYWMAHLPSSIYVNLYGPTEAAVACTYYVVDRLFSDEEKLPIGIPCGNTGILVLDGEGRPAQDGETGELCVLGSSLALGYYRDGERTREAFVQNPCNQDYPERIYRTGDLAYRGPDGNLMYVCRKDFQIKHMGYRIELGEIEAACGLLDGVQTCACTYDEEKKRILLYYTGTDWENAAMKKALAVRLPHYMIPNRVVHLDSMPFNRNGKIDRKALKGCVRQG